MPKKKLTIEEARELGHEIFRNLFYKMDSRDVGAVLCIAIGTLLINAQDEDTFNKYKRIAIETIMELSYDVQSTGR